MVEKQAMEQGLGDARLEIFDSYFACLRWIVAERDVPRRTVVILGYL